MGEPRVGVCDVWATVADVCTPCDDYDFPAGVLEDALEVASNLLFRWSGRQYPGTCLDTVRPCGAARCAGACSCPRLSEIRLGGHPIVDVTTVRLREEKGGALVTLVEGTDYRVDNYTTLVRLPNSDGTSESWPTCQDMGQDAAGDGVFFDVAYTYGRTPPPEGVRAAAALGCELALACQPETAGVKCRLPRRTVQVARQGITISLVDPSKLFVAQPGAPIRTGLWEVDAFLSAHNPGGINRRAVLLSPGNHRRVRRTAT